MIHEKQQVISGALDGMVSDYNIKANQEGEPIHFEKTLSLGQSKNLDPEKKKKHATIFDFDDVDYDMTRIEKKGRSSAKKSTSSGTFADEIPFD